MTPIIKFRNPRKLVGIRLIMSLSNNRTGELWQGFMVRRREILNALSKDLISMQIYGSDYFERFRPSEPFEKWAAAEVADFKQVPPNMETFTLPGGLYAVFNYRGSGNNPEVFQYIYGTWLPGSDYDLDNRPHFEILGDKYKNEDPSSEEEIWIPVLKKNSPGLCLE